MAGILLLGTPANNDSRVTLNADFGFLNLVKGFSFPVDPNNQSSDGYPVTTPVGGSISVQFFNAPLTTGYFDQYVWKGAGAFSMQFSSGTIIYQGAQFITGSGNVGGKGTTGGNTTILANLGPNPRVQFKWGGLIASVSGGSGSLVTITLVGATTGIGTNSRVSLQTGVSSNLSSGPNSDGSWTVTSTGSTTFTLNGSTGIVSPTVTGTGGVGVQSEAVIDGTGQNAVLLTNGPYSSFGDLVVCKLADETPIANGQIIDSQLVSQYQQLMGKPGGVGRGNPGWFRFMNATSVQSSYESDFSQRIPSTYVTYPQQQGAYRPGYWTPSASGAITNGGSDNYTCSDPSVSVWNGSTYIDNAIVQGVPNVTNTGGVPTLAVGGHPAKSIFSHSDGAAPFHLKLSGPPTTPGTDVMVFTFTATWLNGGTPYVFTYNTVVGDTTTSALSGHLDAAIGADATLSAALVFHGNPQGNGPFIYPRTAQAGRLTLTYTSGPAICVVCTISPSVISSTGGGTFVFNYILDGWIYRSGGLLVSMPFEAIVDMCNRVGAHCWFTMPFTKSAWVTAVTNFFADPTTGLTSGLRFGIEGWNEVWNSGAFPYSVLQTLGNALGWTSSSFKSNLGYTGLRTLQYCTLAKSAWIAKGRSANDIYALHMAQLGEGLNGNFHSFQLKGQLMTSSNTLYSTYGGLNGGTEPDHSAFPDRPVDFLTLMIGQAPYWNSKWWGNGSFTDANQTTGSAAQNAPWLQAAKDYANGLTSTAFTSLAQQFQRIIDRTTFGGSTGGFDFVNMQTFYNNQEAIAAQHDSGRAIKVGINHYEGGQSFGIGQNGNNGVNSINNLAANIKTVDITALASRLTALDSPPGTFTVSPYTLTGTDDKTEMATMTLVLMQGWKFDTTVSGAAAGTGIFKNMIKTSYYQALFNTSGANREAHPCQYTYSGPSNWCVTPVSYTAANFYQTFNAISEFNA